ncbi:energy-coupling factor transporter transmembrane protein EcfT [Aequitasia blattaphilus]|uniref:Energy-coupling factor transporter transmembrane protein EcfT n=1 Tax=Aequitasia blattaphilus TaxID=2949332 RepID=A0ABT1EBW8_9FIRM|nr:energy-coupling factor transporter transmembrane component T [Aequitasia blattaphilus]MCP1103308.1 energy-coupling factor transporter transmembrane protein EcfT [Aequitasia blattaphilus]MCR8615948.1 energy-coupling factor transporter transmembrane protein EcfT [Aequitasia blattaphilus]
MLIIALGVLLAKDMRTVHLLMTETILIFLYYKEYRKALKYLLLYLILLGLLYILPEKAGTGKYMFLLFLRMYPMFSIASLFASTPVNLIMMEGEKYHLPKKILWMICILFRFLSLIRLEIKDIILGMRSRGIFPFTYEGIVLPLIVRSLRLSEELTCAARFRGMEAEGKRICIYERKTIRKDQVAFFLFAGIEVAIFQMGVIL